MKLRCALAGLLVVLSGFTLRAGQAQEPPTPTFKAEVEYVEVDALVTDRDGKFVPNLTKDDFQVFEDGKLQTISNFSRIDIPLERQDKPLFAARPIDPDVESNERPFDGRVYVMILDDLHVATLRSQRVKQAARQFIERNLGANDLMAIVTTGGRMQTSQEFTRNKRLLLAAVDQFMGQSLDSVTMSRAREYDRQRGFLDPGQSVDDPDEPQRVYNVRAMLTTLRKVSEWFGGVRGRRKTMLFFSEGINYNLNDVIRPNGARPSSASSLISEIQDTINSTARANVSIYAIDPRGLTMLGDDDITVGSYPDFDDTKAGIGPSSMRNELMWSQNSLRQLADETGGFASVNRNDFRDAFDRIVRDSSSYYVLAYYPPSDKRDGKFHRIEVKVNRPGLVVRSRRGYASPRGKPSSPAKPGAMAPELFEAINSPIQVSGLRMRGFAVPFKGAAPNASILVGVEMLGRDLSLDANSRIELSFLAVDGKGKVFGPRNDAFTMNLRRETRQLVEQSGLRALSRLDLPPGRYQLRIAARDAAKTTVGSLIYDLDVPDFFKQPFTISGLALTSLGGASMMTTRPDEQLKAVLPAPPIGQRTFAQNDEIALFAEIYDNEAKTPHKVDITSTILTDEGRVLFKNEETHDSSELQGAKGGYGYVARVPLSDIPPGEYVLQVEGRSRLGDSPTATRQVQISILPRVR